MANNVIKESDLYEPMRLWLNQYLLDKYQGAEVITIDSHAKALDTYLTEHGVIERYPQIIGIDIEIDVLGIVKKRNRTGIVFIEAKKRNLSIHDLGQLWAYCKLCNPMEAFLLSSAGIGSLYKILHSFSRMDMLDFGDGKTIKKMIVGKWDLSSQSIDYSSIIPSY